MCAHTHTHTDIHANTYKRIVHDLSIDILACVHSAHRTTRTSGHTALAKGLLQNTNALNESVSEQQEKRRRKSTRMCNTHSNPNSIVSSKISFFRFGYVLRVSTFHNHLSSSLLCNSHLFLNYFNIFLLPIFGCEIQIKRDDSILFQLNSYFEGFFRPERSVVFFSWCLNFRRLLGD